mgnify:CR=1 FL=1
MADRTRLVDRLRYERDARIDHALFYWTQVFMAYNSNHMEGSTLTPEQTRQIYDTGRLLADADEQIRLDDAIETRNHFTAFNYVIDHADDPVDAGYVCRLHALLKRGTSQDATRGSTSADTRPGTTRLCSAWASPWSGRCRPATCRG